MLQTSNAAEFSEKGSEDQNNVRGEYSDSDSQQ
jgi:hypothetical protein